MRTSAHARHVAAVLLALAVVVPPPATASAQPGAAAAKEQFATAQKLFDDKNYDAALPQFRKVLADTSSPNARLYVARCLRELGKTVEAYDEMALTVREATTRAESEPKYSQTRDAAAAELALLEPRVGKIVVALANGATAKVTLNGKELPADKVGTPVTVEPGTIVVLATAPGTSGMRQNALVKPGETKTVALNLEATESETEEPPPPPPTPDAPQQTGGTVRTVGFVTAGVGVAGMVLFVVSAVSAQSKFDTLEDECGGQRCTEEKYGETIDTGKTFDTLANVGLIVGLAGLGAGAAMIVFGGPKETSANAALQVSPSGVRLRGRF